MTDPLEALVAGVVRGLIIASGVEGVISSVEYGEDYNELMIDLKSEEKIIVTFRREQ